MSDVAGYTDNSNTKAWKFEEKVVAYTGIEVQQMGRARSQSLTLRVAKVAVTWALNTQIDNERKLQPDLVKGACRVKAFASGCNTIVARPE